MKVLGINGYEGAGISAKRTDRRMTATIGNDSQPVASILTTCQPTDA